MFEMTDWINRLQNPLTGISLERLQEMGRQFAHEKGLGRVGLPRLFAGASELTTDTAASSPKTSLKELWSLKIPSPSTSCPS